VEKKKKLKMYFVFCIQNSIQFRKSHVKKLFQNKGITNVGLIGTGAFGRSFLAQSRLTPGLRVPVVCDRDIENGKHVVMVTKETDCVVGPILNRLAQNAGLVYTPADGDQPSLLIGLISWAEILGFEIVCAGKAAELDFVFDPDSNTVARGSRSASITAEDLWKLRREQDELFEMPDRK
jgi:predicted homoserine dehydrogenase-like protein